MRGWIDGVRINWPYAWKVAEAAVDPIRSEIFSNFRQKETERLHESEKMTRFGCRRMGWPSQRDRLSFGGTFYTPLKSPKFTFQQNRRRSRQICIVFTRGNTFDGFVFLIYINNWNLQWLLYWVDEKKKISSRNVAKTTVITNLRLWGGGRDNHSCMEYACSLKDGSLFCFYFSDNL